MTEHQNPDPHRPAALIGWRSWTQLQRPRPREIQRPAANQDHRRILAWRDRAALIGLLGRAVTMPDKVQPHVRTWAKDHAGWPPVTKKAMRCIEHAQDQPAPGRLKKQVAIAARGSKATHRTVGAAVRRKPALHRRSLPRPTPPYIAALPCCPLATLDALLSDARGSDFIVAEPRTCHRP